MGPADIKKKDFYLGHGSRDHASKDAISERAEHGRARSNPLLGNNGVKTGIQGDENLTRWKTLEGAGLANRCMGSRGRRLEEKIEAH